MDEKKLVLFVSLLDKDNRIILSSPVRGMEQIAGLMMCLEDGQQLVVSHRNA